MARAPTIRMISVMRDQTPDDAQAQQDESEAADADSTSQEEEGESDTVEDEGNAEDASDSIEPDDDLPERSSEQPGSEWRVGASDSARLQRTTITSIRASTMKCCARWTYVTRKS